MEVTTDSVDKLTYNADGLIPAIIQDDATKNILMLAYMNAQSLTYTIAEGRTCFWSRSRQEYWRKGETSGNRQVVKSIATDCDQDTLLIVVDQTGVACHTGTWSCFES
ncbi:phosphoribosyl-AMP cyclohydrolase [Candidatus Neomarinimicrobiota bacterium]